MHGDHKKGEGITELRMDNSGETAAQQTKIIAKINTLTNYNARETRLPIEKKNQGTQTMKRRKSSGKHTKENTSKNIYIYNLAFIQTKYSFQKHFLGYLPVKFLNFKD